ncbi:MAG: U32 family peptidase [Alistipes sp.]|nr:U32 family peptidase [Alistipes sp.]
MKLTELLAPAKDYETAVDAIDCGADAVYIGGSKFGARYAAGNSIDDIGRTVEYAHKFGVRVYATLNTLLFDDEIEEARRQAESLVDTGVDALIVQDAAYCRMGLRAELHASTQMCNMTPEHTAFLADCGFSRVILERALSLEEIRRIASVTDAEIECFVHGAICVGHSGRCFLSRSTCERSGNRGACSQPCRLPYDLTDADRNVIIKGRHLLSLRDMSLEKRIGDLLDAWVTSFKIEGRLKDRIYVRNIVSHYRRALDEAMASRGGFARSSAGYSRPEFVSDPTKSFTRGGTEYYLDGKCAGSASFDTPKAVGEYLGRVVSADRRGFVIDGRKPAAGDGICFITADGLKGTNINGIEGDRIIPNRMDDITVGCVIYRNFDRVFAKSVENARLRRSIGCRAEVSVGHDCLTMTFTDEESVSVTVTAAGTFDKASDAERMNSVVRTQTAKSGDTIFDITEVTVRNDDGLFVPSSVLNSLRREGLQRLANARTERRGERRIFVENRDVPYYKKSLSAQDNVTNRLSEEFYRTHGVENIERGLDLRDSTVGECVMRTSYCLRREIGECLKEGSRLRGELWLEHGINRYLLQFDCARCEMSLVDCTKR